MNWFCHLAHVLICPTISHQIVEMCLVRLLLVSDSSISNCFHYNKFLLNKSNSRLILLTVIYHSFRNKFWYPFSLNLNCLIQSLCSVLYARRSFWRSEMNNLNFEVTHSWTSIFRYLIDFRNMAAFVQTWCLVMSFFRIMFHGIGNFCSERHLLHM